MKLHKALRRHGWQVQRKLEIQGVGKIPDCFKVASLTGRITHRNVQLADGWYSETTCYLLLQVYLSKLWDSWLIIPAVLHVHGTSLLHAFESYVQFASFVKHGRH